jgi:hypothetical protein
VAQTVPTGLTIGGSPITGAGTLAIGLDTGYVIPLQSTLNTYINSVSTSTNETSGQLAYWTTSSGSPAKLNSVATTTLTATAPLALSQAINVLGSTPSALTCTTASSGVAGCLSNTAFDTFNNKVGTARALTVAGTANQITSSAGSQDLSADRTWTLSIPSQFNIQQASTTLFSANQAEVGSTATTTLTSDGKIGIASSTPFGRLSINPIAGDSIAFAVGSSTRTIFQIATPAGEITHNGSYTLNNTFSATNFFSLVNSAGRTQLLVNNSERVAINGSATAPAPNAMLHLTHNFTNTFDPYIALNDSDSYPLLLQNLNGATASTTGIGFTVTNVDDSVGGAIVFERTGGNSQGKLNFYTKQSTSAGVAPVLALTIAQTGYVGVASSSPYKAFSVVGDVAIAGTSAASSTIYLFSSAASKGGSIILEDTDGAGCTEISALNGVLTAATVTCPSE